MNSVSHAGFLHRKLLVLLKVHGVPYCPGAHKTHREVRNGLPIKAHFYASHRSFLLFKNFYFHTTCMIWTLCTLMNSIVLQNILHILHYFFSYFSILCCHWVILFTWFLALSCVLLPDMRMYAWLSIISARGGEKKRFFHPELIGWHLMLM